MTSQMLPVFILARPAVYMRKDGTSVVYDMITTLNEVAITTGFNASVCSIKTLDAKIFNHNTVKAFTLDVRKHRGIFHIIYYLNHVTLGDVVITCINGVITLYFRSYGSAMTTRVKWLEVGEDARYVVAKGLCLYSHNLSDGSLSGYYQVTDDTNVNYTFKHIYDLEYQPNLDVILAKVTIVHSDFPDKDVVYTLNISPAKNNFGLVGIIAHNVIFLTQSAYFYFNYLDDQGGKYYQKIFVKQGDDQMAILPPGVGTMVFDYEYFVGW